MRHSWLVEGLPQVGLEVLQVSQMQSQIWTQMAKGLLAFEMTVKLEMVMLSVRQPTTALQKDR